MARKKYRVALTAEERQTSEQLWQRGKSSARQLVRARILPQADEGLTDEERATALDVGVAPVERTRQRFGERKLAALTDLPRPGGQGKWSGKRQAHLRAVAGTPAPAGQVRWTLPWLAEQVGALGCAPSSARETVRQVLKTTRSPPGDTTSGVDRRGAGRLWRPWQTCGIYMPSLTIPHARRLRSMKPVSS